MKQKRMSGDTLRRRREALGLTQEELAYVLEVNPQTVSNWERGVGRIKRMVGLALAHLAHLAETRKA